MSVVQKIMEIEAEVSCNFYKFLSNKLTILRVTIIK